MAVQGEVLDISKSDICDMLKYCHGRVIHAADKLNIHRFTLYRYLQEYPDLWDVVHQSRKTYREYKKVYKVDLSELYQDKLLTKEDVPYAVGLKASMYILDNLGQDEGYNKPKEDVTKDPTNDSAIDSDNENMALKAQLALLRSQLANQSKTGSELPGIDS